MHGSVPEMMILSMILTPLRYDFKKHVANSYLQGRAMSHQLAMRRARCTVPTTAPFLGRLDISALPPESTGEACQTLIDFRKNALDTRIKRDAEAPSRTSALYSINEAKRHENALADMAYGEKKLRCVSVTCV